MVCFFFFLGLQDIVCIRFIQEFICSVVEIKRRNPMARLLINTQPRLEEGIHMVVVIHSIPSFQSWILIFSCSWPPLLT
jgi:hypothetical protein